VARQRLLIRGGTPALGFAAAALAHDLGATVLRPASWIGGHRGGARSRPPDPRRWRHRAPGPLHRTGRSRCRAGTGGNTDPARHPRRDPHPRTVCSPGFCLTSGRSATSTRSPPAHRGPAHFLRWWRRSPARPGPAALPRPDRRRHLEPRPVAYPCRVRERSRTVVVPMSSTRSDPMSTTSVSGSMWRYGAQSYRPSGADSPPSPCRGTISGTSDREPGFCLPP
jgi:hypothetical protein